MTKLPPLDIVDDRPRVWHYNDVSRPADAVYIGRAMPRQGIAASAWGNPYKVVHSGTNFRVVFATGKLRNQIINSFPERDDATAYMLELYRRLTVDRLKRDPYMFAPLIGHDLVCWCAKKGCPLTVDDETVCHGQVLLRLIAEREGSK